MWQYDKTTKQCVYSSTLLTGYNKVPETLIPDLLSKVQTTNNEVILLCDGNTVEYDPVSYTKYLNTIKNTLLAETDWMIVRHQEEVLNNEIPTLTEKELLDLRNKRNTIRKAKTIEEINNIAL